MATGSGYWDTEGVWMFGEDDGEPLFSDTLNKLSSSVSGGLYSLRDRVVNAEQIAEGTTGTYTPTMGGITAANRAFRYLMRAGHVRVDGQLEITGAVTSGPILLSLPLGLKMDSAYGTQLGQGFAVDVSTGNIYELVMRRYNDDYVMIEAVNTAGTYATRVNLGAAVPFTWAAGDIITVEFAFWAQ